MLVAKIARWRSMLFVVIRTIFVPMCADWHYLKQTLVLWRGLKKDSQDLIQVIWKITVAKMASCRVRVQDWAIHSEIIRMFLLGWWFQIRSTISHRIHVYGIYANIWGILMVNVTIYSIHGSYGQWLRLFRLKPPIRYPHRDSKRYANWIISDAAIPKNHQVDEGTSEKYQSSTLHSPFYHDLNWIAGEHQ